MKRILPVFFSILSLSAASQTKECEHGCGGQHQLLEAAIPFAHTSLNHQKSLVGHYIGSMHEHSSFSDGSPGTSPADYYRTGAENGYDFVMGSEHSDNFNIPVGLHEDCASEKILDCITIDPTKPIDGILKWGTVRKMADSATTGTFVGIRGFEWTSDRTGHINVFFSKNITNAKTDGGYVDISTFYNWISSEPMTLPLFDDIAGGIGGADGLAVFNHPGDKKLSDQDPAYNWNNFTFSEKAEPFMVGIELFNGGDDYASGDKKFYQQALDSGWHIGAIASEDHHGYDWNNASDGKTVYIAPELTTEGLKTAMKNRSFYAVRDHGLRMTFNTSLGTMGNQLVRKTGSKVILTANVISDNVTMVELVTNTGQIVETFTGKTLRKSVEVQDTEQWYYIRATDSTGRSMAYSSPIWIKGGGTVDEATGITENKTTSFGLFPNPIRKGDALIITSENEGQAIITVTNSLGQIAFQGNKLLFKGANQLLNAAQTQLNAGIYFIQIVQDGINSVQQFIIE